MRVTLLLLTVFIGLTSIGQVKSKSRKVVQIMTEQTAYLNGGVRASLGGKSRIIYQIDLPPNTVEWYYIFTATESENPNITLDLIPQLIKALDPTGMTGILASSILSPTGSNSCDIYLMERKNADAFIDKEEFSYNISGTRENYRNGTVQIKNVLSGTRFIGIKNPSSTAGIVVNIEVAAIVEETTFNNDEWTLPTKERFSNLFYKYLTEKNVENDVAREVSNCMVAKMTLEKTPETYDQLTRNEKESYFQSLLSECSEKQEVHLTAEQEKAISYGNLGWTAYEEGDFDKCILLSKKALTLDKSLGYVKANLGLCYLLKNDEETATDFYIDALADFNKVKETRKESIKAVIKDIDDALKKKPNIKGASTIRTMYQGELKND